MSAQLSYYLDSVKRQTIRRLFAYLDEHEHLHKIATDDAPEELISVTLDETKARKNLMLFVSRSRHFLLQQR